MWMSKEGRIQLCVCGLECRCAGGYWRGMWQASLPLVIPCPACHGTACPPRSPQEH